ncbi:hypothetical protein, partial [Actinomadura sp. GC306]|uniref:hypothetical protein n=1 Tax=Actinomadura sp. GC306 TaxID=2530367 RepID=UPI001A9FC04E
GLWAARGEARRALLVCVGTAAVFGGAYFVLTDLAVPRYLLPMFALLSLPAGVGLTAILRAAWRRRAGRVLAAGVVAVVLLHTGSQAAKAGRVAERAEIALSWPEEAAGALAARGVDGDCVVLGRFAPQIAFLRRCRGADMRDGLGDRDASAAVTEANVGRLRDRGLRVVLAVDDPPDVPGRWSRVPVPGTGPLLYLSQAPARR